MELRETEKVIERFFVEREGEGVLETIRDIDFIEEGILDSLDLVSLSAFIESNLGKKIDVTDEVVFRSIRRFDSLVEMVS
jgi:acyl carrier protein